MEEKIRKYIITKGLGEILPLEKNFKVYFLAQGEYNKNYVLEDPFRKYVFRINFGSQIQVENQIDYEFKAIKHLEGSGVTPKGYYVDSSRNWLDQGILIMQFLEGTPLDYNQNLQDAAKIFNKIHRIEINLDMENYFIQEKYIFSDRLKEAKYWLKNFWNSNLIPSAVKVIFEKLINYLEQNKNQEKYFLDTPWHCINNTEVNSHNFIINKENAYLIDWEKPVISDPCQDLTHFLAVTTTKWKSDTILTKNQIDEFYRTYEMGDPFFKEKKIRERVNLYSPCLYLRALSWCANTFIAYQDSHKLINNQTTYEKIKEYLDVNFLKETLKEWIK